MKKEQDDDRDLETRVNDMNFDGRKYEKDGIAKDSS